MTLVNTNGLVLFGQGSEWFWSMAQFVVVAVTLVGIYLQLRIARSANASAQLAEMEKEWDSERLTRGRLEYCEALKAGLKPAAIVPAVPADLVDYWEHLAILVRQGHFDRKLLHGVNGAAARWWWAALAHWVDLWRLETGNPGIAEHFEWLAETMARMDANAGVTTSYDDARVAHDLESRIASARRNLRVAEELRAVIVRPLADDARTTA